MGKRVLITGKSSYIANSFCEYVEAYQNEKSNSQQEMQGKSEGLEIELISVRDEAWRDLDFTKYDVILHCAGIVHQKESNVSEAEYDRVNHWLTKELAEKAKNAGVEQFIFLSTMNVYGMTNGFITEAIEPHPKSLYGRTKLQAEKELQKLAADSFKVCILRPPMIYGKGAKGNYPRLAMLARKLPVFPNVNNKRSMLYIENLCELIRLLIEDGEAGIFFPQDKEYVRTSEMVKQIAKCHGKKIILTPIFNPMLRLMSGMSVVKKVFGSLVYDRDMSEYGTKEYRIKGFEESIRISENVEVE